MRWCVALGGAGQCSAACCAHQHGAARAPAQLSAQGERREERQPFSHTSKSISGTFSEAFPLLPRRGVSGCPNCRLNITLEYAAIAPVVDILAHCRTPYTLATWHLLVPVPRSRSEVCL
jgi:hypothetical protein